MQRFKCYVTSSLRIVCNQEYIPFASLGIWYIAPLCSSRVVTTVNHIASRITSHVSRVVSIIGTVVTVVVIVSIKKAYITAISVKQFFLCTCREWSPTDKVNITTITMLHVNKKITRVVDSHYKPSRRRCSVQTAYILAIVTKFGSTSTCSCRRIGVCIVVGTEGNRIATQRRTSCLKHIWNSIFCIKSRILQVGVLVKLSRSHIGNAFSSQFLQSHIRYAIAI